MKLQTKIYIVIAVAVIFAAGILGSSAWSSYKTAKLERAIESAKADAVKSQAAADEMEKQAAAYAAKTEYLEQKLADIKAIARKQDEELEKLNANTNSARADVERARRIRTAAANADELCAKLAELGHRCE